MDVLHEIVRCLAAVFGAGAFLALNKSPSWRAGFAMIVPGSVAGIFFAPLLCEAAQAWGGMPWMHCGEPAADCGIAVSVGFLGHGGANLVLIALPAWIKAKFGVPLPAPRTSSGKPPSDPQPVV